MRQLTTQSMALLLLLAATGPALGQFDPFGETEQEELFYDSRDVVAVEVIPDRTRVAPGDQVRIAVVLAHDPGWHSHTNDPQVPPELGEAEQYFATVIDAEVPDGGPITVYPKHIGWPEPHATEVAWLGDPVAYDVFEGRAVAYLPAIVAPDAPLGTTRIVVKAGFQACDENSCMAPTPYPPRQPGETASQDWLDYGIPIEIEIVALADAQSRDAVDRELFAAFPEEIWGLIASGADFVEFGAFGRSFEVDAGSTLGFMVLLIVAALGGFLLNLTPCVLPVIPIKIMGLSQSAAGSRGRTLALGIAMSIGVVGFWLLIATLIAAASGFTATNQLFQYPAFTIGVGIFIAFMAVGMCGLFAVRLPQFVYLVNPNHETLHGSLIFGVMTAVLSTPCTAPFLGAAAAWAATQSAVVTLAVFAAIGLGMALPYLVLSAFPNLVARMPRTGPASEVIKQVMGLLMLAAAAYFVGVGLSGALVSPPDPPSRVYWWFVGLFGVAAGGWLVWRTVRVTRRAVPRAVFVTIGSLILAISAYIGVRMTDHGPIDWVYYTPDRFAEARAEGNVVVMEFTAEWCLNCKALEESVLRSRRVATLLNGEGVVPIKVDLTGNNTDGNDMLAAVKWVGIPLLVIFRADGTEVFKGDFYTVDQVVEAVERAGT